MGKRIQGDERVLIVRLGAMGDILHALPAVESLKRAYPGITLDWVVKSRWLPLLEGNPALRQAIGFDRGSKGSIWRTARTLRRARYHLAIDLQGLLQSAAIAWLSGARHLVGFSKEHAREGLASTVYHTRVAPVSTHIVRKHGDVMRALGVECVSEECHLPPGRPEGNLPDGPFVLANPFAGWPSKQWPLAYYSLLGAELEKAGYHLVLNVAERDLAALDRLPHVVAHSSSIAGLIDATRRAAAVLGLDSGPLHLAAALAKPGVALFGPTDPARNGPVGGSIRVLRHESARTSYKREREINSALRALTPEVVLDALAHVLPALSAAKGEQHR